MQKHKIVWKILFAILGMLLACSELSMADQSVALTHNTATAKIGEAEKYIGKVLENRVQHQSGFLVVPKGDSSYLKPDAQPLAGVHVRDDQGRNFFLLTEVKKNEAGERSDFVHGAIEIPEGLTLGGHPIEDECVVTKHPQEIIFAIGKQVYRHSKDGSYIGGYIRPIKAWRVDFTAKKLVEIPTINIKCEVGKNIGED